MHFFQGLQKQSVWLSLLTKIEGLSCELTFLLVSANTGSDTEIQLGEK